MTMANFEHQTFHSHSNNKITFAGCRPDSQQIDLGITMVIVMSSVIIIIITTSIKFAGVYLSVRQ